MIVPNEKGSNANSLTFGRNGKCDLAVACLNVIAALALVAVSLLLVLAVSSVAWLYDRHKWIQPIRVAQSRGR